MDLTAPSSSKMDGEGIKNANHDLTYVIFRFEDKSIAPVPVNWIINDLIEEYNECFWPEHLTTVQILTAMKEYSIERKETWPIFKGIVLDVYLNYTAASKACDLFKDTETSLKDELQIEQYFKSQSNKFRNAEKSERIKLNKVTKRSQEEVCFLHETSTVIDKRLQGPCRKRTLEDIAQIGLQADLQAYIKKVEQKRANIELYKENVVEKNIPNIMAEQDENKMETNMCDIKVNNQPAKNTKSPKNFIPSNYLELNTEEDTQHYTTDLTYQQNTYFETQIFAEERILSNSLKAQKNSDNLGHDAFIHQLKGLKENINQCETNFDSFSKECEPLKLQNSSSATFNNSEIKSNKLEQYVNLSRCLEHSDNVLNLRCLTHKAWICHICCEDDHPKNECYIVTFEEELKNRKYKEEQRLQEESKTVSDTISSLFELGNEKERKRNENIQKIKEMQAAIKKVICDTNQLGNEMSFLKEVMSDGKELQQKLNEKKDNVNFATTISQLASFTKSYLNILAESKNWCEKYKKKI